ncbi:hypothetical protein WN48_04176, partial [Eufriesea mexicana]
LILNKLKMKISVNEIDESQKQMNRFDGLIKEVQKYKKYLSLLLDIGTLKINNDYVKIIQNFLGTIIDETDKYNEYGLLPPKFNDLLDINESYKLKTFRQIIESLEDDSISSITENDKNNMNQYVNVEDDLNYQMNQTLQIGNNTFDFVSPVTQLTALNVNLGEGKDAMIEGKSLFINAVDSCLSTQVSDKKDFLCSKIEDKTDKQQSMEETTSWNKLQVLSSDEEDSVKKEINQESKKRVSKL